MHGVSRPLAVPRRVSGQLVYVIHRPRSPVPTQAAAGSEIVQLGQNRLPMLWESRRQGWLCTGMGTSTPTLAPVFARFSTVTEDIEAVVLDGKVLGSMGYRTRCKGPLLAVVHTPTLFKPCQKRCHTSHPLTPLLTYELLFKDTKTACLLPPLQALVFLATHPVHHGTSLFIPQEHTQSFSTC